MPNSNLIPLKQSLSFLRKRLHASPAVPKPMSSASPPSDPSILTCILYIYIYCIYVLYTYMYRSYVYISAAEVWKRRRSMMQRLLQSLGENLRCCKSWSLLLSWPRVPFLSMAWQQKSLERRFIHRRSPLSLAK